MRQILVLVAQSGKVAIVERLFLVALGHSIQLQQSCLTEEDSLDLKQIVAMVRHSTQGHILRPLFEHIAINAKAVVAGQGSKIAILPRAVATLYTLSDIGCFALQALNLQGCHPRVNSERGQIRYHLITGRILLGLAQFIVMCLHMRRYIQLQLRYVLAVALHHFGIQFPGYMQYHIVVIAVLVVPMHVPVARLVVNLNIARPHSAIYANLSIHEIGPGIAVVLARIDHLNQHTIACKQLFQRKKLQFPSIME